MSGLLIEFLWRQVALRSDAEALVAAEGRLTWGELGRRVTALARALRARGVQPGDRVVIFLDSGLDAATAFWAVQEAGGVVSMVNAHTKSDKLQYYLTDLGAKVLLTQPGLHPTFGPVVDKLPALARVLVSGAWQAQGRLERWVDAAAAEAGGARLEPARVPEDLAAIIYTSGTTGEPKGVALAHTNMTFAAESTCQYLELNADDVLFNVLPLSFSYGLYQLLTAARVGAKTVLEKSFAFPVRVLEKMAAERATSFAGVPTLFAMLAELAPAPPVDLSRVRIVTNAAAALPEHLVPFIARRFPKARFFSMYGQTECMRISYLPPELAAAKPRCVGVPIPGTSFRVVDEAGQPLGPGVAGELVVTGPHVMQAYWNRPEATAQKVRGGPDPKTRELWTRDSCRLDADGHLYMLGRMDDVIKSRGEKVPPLEVERALMDVPGVREAAVIGVPDPVLGMAIKGFVVLNQGVTLGERQLIVECQKRLEPFMVPRWVERLEALPKNPSGKVLKSALR